MITNALTIDVEDYFQVHAFSGAIHREDWDSFEPRVERNTHRILDLLDSYSLRQAKGLRRRWIDSSQYQQETEKTKQSKKSGKSCQTKPQATFFVLGWIADRFPSLVKEIHKRGHEVACHGYAHKCIFDQTREEFIEDVKRAK